MEIKSLDDEIKADKKHWRYLSLTYWNRIANYWNLLLDDPRDILIVFIDSYEYNKHYTCDSFSRLATRDDYTTKYYRTEIRYINQLCDCLEKTYNKKVISRLKEIQEKDKKYRSIEGGITDKEWHEKEEID